MNVNDIELKQATVKKFCLPVSNIFDGKRGFPFFKASLSILPTGILFIIWKQIHK